MVKIKNLFFWKKLCKHKLHDIGLIIIHDIIFDKYIDNDDWDDLPTYIKVFYCKKCGKILGVKNYRILIIPDYLEDLSSYEEVEEFETITGIDIKTITKYNKEK